MSILDKTLLKAEKAMKNGVIRQLAALCYRKNDGKREVLLVTSSAGRWILPKGWPISGLKDREAAMVEAWEEGGVKKGKATRKPVGTYAATKSLADGAEVPCEVAVYEVKVSKAVKNYPEADARDRVWVTPKKAAKMVSDKGLRKLLEKL